MLCMSGDRDILDRRTILKTVGTVGLTGGLFTGNATATRNSNPTEVTTSDGKSEIEPQSRIPGISYDGTYSYSNICWLAGGSCVAIASPLAPIAAAACKVSGTGCFILGALDYMGCSDADLEVYYVSSYVPIPADILVIPSCIRSSTYSVILDMLEEYGFDPWNWSPFDATETDGTVETSNIGTEGIVFSEDFISEYDAEDLLKEYEADTY